MAFRDILTGTAGRFGYDPVREQATAKRSVVSKGPADPRSWSTKVSSSKGKDSSGSIVHRDEEDIETTEPVGWKASERIEDASTPLESAPRKDDEKEGESSLLEQYLAAPPVASLGQLGGSLRSSAVEPYSDGSPQMADPISRFFASAEKAVGEKQDEMVGRNLVPETRNASGEKAMPLGWKNGDATPAPIPDWIGWMFNDVDPGSLDIESLSSATAANKEAITPEKRGSSRDGGLAGSDRDTTRTLERGLSQPVDWNAITRGMAAIGGPGAAMDDIGSIDDLPDPEEQAISDFESDDINAFMNAWENYQKHNGLGGYGSFADFQAGGTEDEWYNFLTNDDIRQYYQGSYDAYGDLADKANFNALWNDFKPVTLDDLVNEGSGRFIEDWTGADAMSVQNLIDYMYANGYGYDFGGNTVTAEDPVSYEKDVLAYDMLGRIMQDRLSRYGADENLFGDWSLNEINELAALDPMMLLPQGYEGVKGTLSEAGKTGDPNVDRFYQPSAAAQYGGIPWTNLWDMVSAAAGDPDIYYMDKPLPAEEEQQ